ncbi:hypothetical protein [Geomobilimonas luticola]|uniref:CARD domain-containing protein n=1 Tax=Geomobilimonas luticola TaxID=1114878 RepID=A0ABS5SEA3_9BACT|nr:hypothetical protein [Geomobilimonas luticola]MBT0653510.1 hypothetical protein [Geomobilimonas luticola]
MSEKLTDDQAVALEEAVISTSCEIAALVNILERKGLITRNELTEEVQRIRESMRGMIVTYK